MELLKPNFFEMLSLAALVCGGVTVASLPGGILSGVKQWLSNRVRRGLFPEWLAKPLLLCDTCMASVWGIPQFILWLLDGPSWLWAAYYGIAFVCGLALLNYACWTLLSTFGAIRDRNADASRAQGQHHQSGHRPDSKR